MTHLFRHQALHYSICLERNVVFPPPAFSFSISKHISQLTIKNCNSFALLFTNNMHISIYITASRTGIVCLMAFLSSHTRTTNSHHSRTWLPDLRPPNKYRICHHSLSIFLLLRCAHSILNIHIVHIRTSMQSH